jgi:hypothetical protein
MTPDDVAERIMDRVTQEDLELLRTGRDAPFVCAVRERAPELGVTAIRSAIPILRALG